MSEDLSSAWLSDEPIDGIDRADILSRRTIVGNLAHVLNRVQENSKSSVISLVGPWGSGKTSILKMLEHRLGEEKPIRDGTSRTWSIGHFDPWLYTDADSLHSGFFEELRATLPKGGKWTNLRDQVSAYGQKLAPLGTLGQFFGADVSGAIKATSALAGRSTSGLRDAAAEALKKTDTSILIVIDDLDRLSASELLLVFKLIRLIARLPNVYYLISYDESTLVDLLMKTDLVGQNDSRRAHEYLEKITQIRVDVPLLRDYEVDELARTSVLEIAKRHNVKLSTEECHSMVENFDAIVSGRVRTPRAIKRLFGQLDVALEPVYRKSTSRILRP